MAEYAWKLKASLELANLPTVVNGPGGTPITLRVLSNANLTARLSTGVLIDWKDSPLIDAFYALVHNPRRVPVTVESTVATDIYEVAANSLPAALTGTGVTVTVVQPSVTITPNVQWMSINGGKGISVFFDCAASFTPGSVEISHGVSVPAPPPFNSIPLPPLRFTIGRPLNSRVVAEYQLIWTDYADLAPWDAQNFPPLLPYDRYEDLPVGPPGQTDVRVEVTQFQKSGDTAELKFLLTAEEGGTPAFYEHSTQPPPNRVLVTATQFGIPARRVVTR
jgi:hypothetical protein